MTMVQEYTVDDDGRGRYALTHPYVMRDQGLRTADDLVAVVIGDVGDVLLVGGFEKEAEKAKELYAEACALWGDDGDRNGWLEDPDASETLRDILADAEQIDHVNVAWYGDAGTVWTTIADEWEWLEDECTGSFDDSGQLTHKDLWDAVIPCEFHGVTR